MDRDVLMDRMTERFREAYAKGLDAVERWEMVEYPQALARGWDIGSGPTEAMGKNLTLRLKRTGMKWDADHAADLMNLVTLRESGPWAAYWDTRRIA